MIDIEIGYKDTQTKRENLCILSSLASMIHNIHLGQTPFLRTLAMMRIRVGLQHVLNDPVGLIYSIYFTQY